MLDLAFSTKLLRQARGLSQYQLASRMHCNRAMIAKIECRTVCPTIATVERLARALQVRPDILILISCAMPES
jgi:transcriptional regulator with XRE-family HTH domain